MTGEPSVMPTSSVPDVRPVWDAKNRPAPGQLSSAGSLHRVRPAPRPGSGAAPASVTLPPVAAELLLLYPASRSPLTAAHLAGDEGHHHAVAHEPADPPGTGRCR